LVPALKLPQPFASLGELVERLGVDDPDDPAVRAAGRTFSRGELAATARSLAAGWSAAGFAPGEVVGVAGEGGPALVHALFSVSRAGLVPLLLDPRLSAEEILVVFERARPRALAVCDGAAVANGEKLRRFEFSADGCLQLVRAVTAGDETSAPPNLPNDPHATAVMLVTSGTSGAPRVVALSAENLSSNIRAGCEAHYCARGEVFLSLLPPTHAFELTTGLLGPLACGAAVVFPGTRNPNRLLGLLSSESVTRVNVVPAILSMMAAEIRDAEQGRDIIRDLRGRLHSIMCGGAPVSQELMTRVGHLLPLWVGYGLTEASPIVALGRAEELPPGSTGRPLPGVEVRIDDTTGEVLVRGPNIMKGYAGDADATAAAIRDGWLHTGDLGRLDASGNLFIVGRCRELIVTAAGLKLLPDVIESVYRSPLFAEVCAVGVPNLAGGGGERPHLAVVPAPGSDGEALLEEFRNLSTAAGDRRAFAVTLLDSPLPRTRTLKVRRDLVRALVIEREGVRS
jgi:long-chain acyl-CoA synthetase